MDRQKLAPKHIGIQSIERAFAILEMLSKSKTPIGVSELSEELGINRTTIYGLLNTLIQQEYVKKTPTGSQYTVTSKMYTLSCSYPNRLQVVRYAAPYMNELSRRFGMTVHLGTLTTKNVILLVNVVYPQSTFTSGSTFPLHCSALGKTMLAFMPEEKSRRIIDEIQFKPYTKSTITDKDEFMKELDRIRAQGYATDKEEYLEGSTCFAFPIYNEKAEIIAAMSVSCITSFIQGKEDEIVTEGLRCSKQCSVEMGWQR